MARRRSGSSFFLFFLLFIIGVVGGYVFFFTDLITIPKTKNEEVVENENTDVFGQTEEWVPEVVWNKPKAATEQVYYGTVKGVAQTGKIVNKEGFIAHFEDPEFLRKLGYKEDLNLAADGPGSSMWGYGKNIGDLLQIITFSYDNEDMHPSSDGPLEADCPCTLNLKVFVSDAFKPNWK